MRYIFFFTLFLTLFGTAFISECFAQDLAAKSYVALSFAPHVKCEDEQIREAQKINPDYIGGSPARVTFRASSRTPETPPKNELNHAVRFSDFFKRNGYFVPDEEHVTTYSYTVGTDQGPALRIAVPFDRIAEGSGITYLEKDKSGACQANRIRVEDYQKYFLHAFVVVFVPNSALGDHYAKIRKLENVIIKLDSNVLSTLQRKQRSENGGKAKQLTVTPDGLYMAIEYPPNAKLPETDTLASDTQPPWVFQVL